MSYSNNKLKKNIKEKIEHLFKLDDLKEKKKKTIFLFIDFSKEGVDKAIIFY